MCQTMHSTSTMRMNGWISQPDSERSCCVTVYGIILFIQNWKWGELFQGINHRDDGSSWCPGKRVISGMLVMFHVLIYTVIAWLCSIYKIPFSCTFVCVLLYVYYFFTEILKLYIYVVRGIEENVKTKIIVLYTS